MYKKDLEGKEYTVYKIHHCPIPIVGAWVERENILDLQTRHVFRDGLLTFGIAFASLTAGSINLEPKDPVVGALSLTGALYALITGVKKLKLNYKKSKFHQAIIHYDELKKYETLYPNKKKITNNPELKGVSKRKILKRANCSHQHYDTHYMY